MGGVDKGLQNFRGLPLALHTLMRLQMQTGNVMVNANRNLAAYEAFGTPVWPDVLSDYAGPLAGFLTGLERCETPWLLTVPCDTPLFPLDLAQRLAAAADAEGADIAMAAAPEDDGKGHITVRPQPVDQRHAQRGRGGEDAGRRRQAVVAGGQRQRGLTEHDRRPRVAGVVRRRHDRAVAHTGAGPGGDLEAAAIMTFEQFHHQPGGGMLVEIGRQIGQPDLVMAIAFSIP